ncbi:CLUMA_CG015696, isoform A [Clunio marinus]|uniref:CLUMA_CG015696, isoform A n=1 Tax=Clunio marinus TaxID=568069 RepID=A0A1J1IP98_9DIPT|nr:CLUMA_CG015696, isoform A [Clunio marinus]
MDLKTPSLKLNFNHQEQIILLQHISLCYKDLYNVIQFIPPLSLRKQNNRTCCITACIKLSRMYA